MKYEDYRNEFEIDGDICRVKVYSTYAKPSINYYGKPKGEFIIDVEDLEIVRHIRWSMGANGYISNPTKGYIDRFILGVSNPSITVDHEDRNPSNNRRSNLRKCSHAENCRNRAKYKTNTSGYKGVYWYKPLSKWKVQITVDRKTRHIGYFSDLVEAAKAYNQAALKYHGQYARLNPC